MSKEKKMEQTASKEEVIYLAIDHLKRGTYQLKVLLRNKVIKTVTIIK